MSKRIKKKYRPFVLIWKTLDYLNGKVERLFELQFRTDERFEELEKRCCKNAESTNAEFSAHLKRIEKLEKEVERLKRPWYKRK
ncbi:TPA: hypothetical protein U1629_000202 [Streptococcus suis]|uniref:Uncharacterized protein n=1 Tax=Streptococcus suis TaxID=1307 RepID=A0A7T1LAV3_STRSU|nr:hypothetical protein [Streptococcus suis]MCK3895741.1 hypothetical protein [Streptococcus suis]MCQ8272080.1 hypothetical protein [Streptococcus suis]MDD7565624.1 hypothetical protein [Streptococcus suis]MDG4501805.1 hypothetical protein [Streptococcus suis]MDW8720757.1 hypothetical protein [Streptococcus suis]